MKAGEIVSAMLSAPVPEDLENAAVKNGGLVPPPVCYICRRVVNDVPRSRMLLARRELNTPTVLAWPGENKKHPSGVVFHSYCAPGTLRWARSMDPANPDQRAWLVRFGFDPDAVPLEGEMANGEENGMAKKAKRAKKEKVAKAPARLEDKRLPNAGTVLKREYKGKEIEVKVLTNSLIWKDKEYASLSAVAKAITGYRTISGFQFFAEALGLKAEPKPRKKKEKAA